jgi:hypothetical protein
MEPSSKAREHLRILAAKNKLRREHAERAISPGAKVRAAKEAAFQTHLRGANSNRTTNTNNSGGIIKQSSSNISSATGGGGGGLGSQNSRVVIDSRSTVPHSPRAASASSSTKAEAAGADKSLQKSKNGSSSSGVVGGPISKWGALDGGDNASTIYFATAGGGKVRVGKRGADPHAPHALSSPSIGDDHRDIPSSTSLSPKKGVVKFSGIVGSSTDEENDHHHHLPLPASSYFIDSNTSLSENSNRENVFFEHAKTALQNKVNYSRNVLYNYEGQAELTTPSEEGISESIRESPLHAAAIETVDKKAVQQEYIQQSPRSESHKHREGGGGEKDADILTYLSSMMQDSSRASFQEIEEKNSNPSKHGKSPVNVSSRKGTTTVTNSSIATTSNKKKKNVSVLTASSPSPPPPLASYSPTPTLPLNQLGSRSPLPRRISQSPQLSPTRVRVIAETTIIESPRVPISHSPINLGDEKEENDDNNDALLSLFPLSQNPPPKFSPSPQSPSRHQMIQDSRGLRPPPSPPPPPPPPHLSSSIAPPPPLLYSTLNNDKSVFDPRLDHATSSSFASEMVLDDSVIDPLRSSWMPLPLSTQTRTSPRSIQPVHAKSEDPNMLSANVSTTTAASAASAFVDVPSWRAAPQSQSKLATRLRSKTDRTREASIGIEGNNEEIDERETENNNQREHQSFTSERGAYDHILRELREEEVEDEDEKEVNNEYRRSEDNDDDEAVNENISTRQNKKKDVIIVDTDDINDMNDGVEDGDDESFDNDEDGGTSNRKDTHMDAYGKPIAVSTASKYLRYENNDHSYQEVTSSNRPQVSLPPRSPTPVPLGSPGGPVLALNFNDSVLSPGSIIVPSTHMADISSSLASASVVPSPGDGVLNGTGVGVGELFSIPELPRGRLLRLRVLSTWGGDDGNHPVAGLTGVEFFSSTGELIPCTATATKNEIPPTPAKTKHSRTPPYDQDDNDDLYDEEDEEEEEGFLTGASKLLNGNNITCDPQEMFRCYFDPPELGADAEVGFGGLVIEFDFGRKRRDTALAMARIYNYNRSRVHSYCGARLVRLELDGKRIFEGELRRAPGNILGDGHGAESALRACSETILFTVDPEILSRVEANDPQADRLRSGNVAEQDVVDYYLTLAALTRVENARPSTAELVPSTTVDNNNSSSSGKTKSQPSLFFRRLIKAAAVQSPQSPRTPHSLSQIPPPILSTPQRSSSTPIQSSSSLRKKVDSSVRNDMRDVFLEEESDIVKPSLVIDEEEEEDHGDESFDEDNINQKGLQLQSPSRRQLDKDAKIISDLISGLEINEGVDTASLFSPSQEKQGREGGGTQTVVALQPPEPPLYPLSSSPKLSSDQNNVSTIMTNLYEPLALPAGSLLPTGRVLTFHILSTHGDPFYAGLTGIEIRALSDDATSIERVDITPNQMHAVPSDINGGDDWSDDEDNVEEDEDDIGRKGAISSKDVRTIDKLVDGVNITTDDTHMWLIPYAPPDDIASGAVAKKLESTLVALPVNRQRHILTIDLGRPRAIAFLKVWNYNKSLEDSLRGVRHCSIELDEVPLSVPRWNQSYSRDVKNSDPVEEDYTIGGRLISSYDVFSFRRAPGLDSFDFGQTVLLARPPLPSHSKQAREWIYNAPTPSLRQPSNGTTEAATATIVAVKQDTIVVQELPVGQLLRFVFPTGLGDPHYIGLDAIAIYDASGVRVPVRPRNIHALPPLSSLESSSNQENHFGIEKGDSRVAGNLGFAPSAFSLSLSSTCEECLQRRDDPALYIQPITSSSAPVSSSSFPASRSWLYPLLSPHPDVPSRGQGNELVFLLNEPVRISLIRIFNYSKTPARGAGSVQVWLDGNLIFLGELQPAPSSMHQTKNRSGRVDVGMIPRPCSSIAFSSNPTLLKGDYDNGYISYCGSGEQGVVLYNEGAIVGKLSQKQELALRALKDSHKAGNVRPKTSLVLNK